MTLLADDGAVLVVGGTSGIGLETARHYAKQGRETILTGRDANRAAAAADPIGGRGVALDLTRPYEVGEALTGIGDVRHLVLSAIIRDDNKVGSYDVASALELTTLKLVGYTAVVDALRDRLVDDASIVVLGGQAMRRPYPGSTTVSTVNGGVIGLVNSLAVELAPVRTNALHPGIVGDSPHWRARPPEVLAGIADRTPTKRLATMAEIVHAITFLLENPSVNGESLAVDGGWLLT